jgi:hypothetical protein
LVWPSGSVVSSKTTLHEVGGLSPNTSVLYISTFGPHM